MKYANICPKCGKKSFPLNYEEHKTYKFCPYCGASYTEEYSSSGIRSMTKEEVIMEPGELRGKMDEMYTTLKTKLRK